MNKFWTSAKMLLLSLGAPLVLAIGMILLSLLLQFLGMETVGVPFLLGFPIVATALILRFRPKGRGRGVLRAIAYLCGVWALALVGAFVFGLEGLICIAMAVAPILLGTTLGGLIYIVYLRLQEAKKNGAKLVVVMPLLALMVLDGGLKNMDSKVHSISNEVVIDAAPEVVFAMLKAIPDIRPEEVSTRFSHLLGVPKPTEARWVSGPNGVVRHSHWGPEVHFQERIVEVVENRKIAWEFEFPEGWVSERIEDPHVRVGGQYFDVLSGGYVLQDLGQQTRLTLTTRTWDNSGLGFYAKFWHRFFIEDFHEVVLALVKARIEAL